MMTRRYGKILFCYLPPHRLSEWIQQEFNGAGLLEDEWFFQPAIWNQWGREKIIGVPSRPY